MAITTVDRNSKYTITEGTLTDIADAIRAQLETEAQFDPVSMPAAIMSISGGGGSDSPGLVLDCSGGNTEMYPLNGLNAVGNSIKYDNADTVNTGTISDLCCQSLTINATGPVETQAAQIAAIEDYIKITAAAIAQNAITLYDGELTNLYIILSCPQINDQAVTIGDEYQGGPLTICFLTQGEINGSAISGNTSRVSDIYVPWSEGEVSGDPWGAYGATIHYNSLFDDTGKPI